MYFFCIIMLCIRVKLKIETYWCVLVKNWVLSILENHRSFYISLDALLDVQWQAHCYLLRQLYKRPILNCLYSIDKCDTKAVTSRAVDNILSTNSTIGVRGKVTPKQRFKYGTQLSNSAYFNKWTLIFLVC